MLFTLIEKIDISPSEKAKIDAILDVDSSSVFLTIPLVNRYAPNAKNIDVDAAFSKTTWTIPVYCVAANSVVRVSITGNGKTSIYEDWTIKEVKRSNEGFESFVVTYTSEDVKDQTWSADSTVEVEILNEAGTEYDPVVIRFQVSKYSKFIWETVEFEQVSFA